MPLQKSVYKVKGKMDGMSYFYSKNGGYQFRQINPNMSELVKTDPRFALTRDYGFAFGEGANFAGVLLKAIGMRWRFIMRSNTHAKLTKKYNEYFKLSHGLDSGAAVHISLCYDAMRNDFNALNKVEIPNWISSFFPAKTDENVTDQKLEINESLEVTSAELDSWINKGADGFNLYLFKLQVTKESIVHGGALGSRYVAALSSRPIRTGNVTFDGSDTYTVLQASTPALDGLLEPTDDTCGGILVYVAPFRRINNSLVVLQSLCSSYWYRPQVVQ